MQRNFQLFKQGVYDGECDTQPDHAVTAVGYGKEDNEEYWYLKNSWGRKLI